MRNKLNLTAFERLIPTEVRAAELLQAVDNEGSTILLIAAGLPEPVQRG
jgi:hypothetical protein